MNFKKINSNIFLIRLDRGEKIIQSLQSFCQKNKIQGGFFYGIGAVDNAEIAHYDVATKKYSSKKINQALEMTAILGNVGFFEKEIIIHAHVNFADKQMKVIGGHLVEAEISGTGEIFFVKLSKLTKKYNQETGLKLFEFKKN